ncbi:proline/glycine betaine ABC transporter permease [Burkholderia sp. S171]|uniref:ABC transporter permease n=1 Tax=Burkholderia sp. S171 TaxID=1641860 RepID=UPI00131C47CF|nr:proline/glycine betaine ABC transporter permease [Burkholderia sp. S171]
MTDFFLHLNFANTINVFFADVVARYGDLFHAVSVRLLVYGLNPVETLLHLTPAPLLIFLIGIISWVGNRKLLQAAFLMLLIYLIGCLGLWEKLILTLAIMLVSLAITTVLGIPLGIGMAKSSGLRRVLNPVLDLMQTLPSFVYLIPVLMLFGLGKVPAILATTIYALPPLTRLTELGLRQVPADVLEAADAFGAHPIQKLLKVELPLALPSIMTGLNQAVMMSLAMVVVASMIGARGLGEDVLAGINNLDMGLGAQAGLAIVILAVVFDRVTQGFSSGRRNRRKMPSKSIRKSVRKQLIEDTPARGVENERA